MSIRLSAEDKANIAKNLRALRLAKFPGKDGLKRCAIDMGVSPNQYAPWESGSRIPIGKNLQLIAQYFEVTLEQLCTATAQAHISNTVTEEQNLPPAHPAKPKRTRKRRSASPVQVSAFPNTTSLKQGAVKIMNLSIPPEVSNLKAIKVTYKGEISLIAIEFVNE